MKGRFIIFLLLALPALALSQRQKVLVFHSYHQGLQWTDNVNKGIQQAFGPVEDSVELFFEYLDRKRNLSEPYHRELKKLYDIKLNDESFDLILAVDNDALEFVVKNREAYFSDVPLVFCGINNYHPDLIEGQTNLTGVIEKPDFSATLDLIHDYHPEVKNLFIINDNKTTTAIENKKSLARIEPLYKEKLKFYFLESLPKTQFKDTIRELDKNSALLLLTYNKDKKGDFISYRENRELVPDDTPLPVYTTWKFFMQGNVIGGKMISGEDQGLRAGKRAIKILRGTPADSLPINESSLSEYVFNYKMLQKHNIREDRLPPGSEVLNKPKSFYTINKKWINTGLIALTVAFVIILVLTNAIIRRRKAEKSLIEKQNHLQKNYRFQKLMADVVALLNSTNDFTKVTDKVLQLITEHYKTGKVSLYNFNEEESIAQVIGTNVSSTGRGITELREQDYHKLNRIIDEVRKNNYFVSSDLSNLTEEEHQFYEKREIGAIAIFPVRIGKKLFGMAGFAYPNRHYWEKSELEEIATIVRMIANAWERNIQMNKHLEVEKKHVKAIRMVEKSSRLASVGVIASGITHEINQPLNALRVTVDSIKYWDRKNEGQLPDFVRNKLETLLKGVSRIDEIIRHMREFWVAPHERDKNKEVDLTQAVKNAHSLVERQIYDHGIKSVLDVPDEEIMVHASFIQIEQIIINLVVNSIHAHDNKDAKDKRIIISTRSKEDCAEIAVSDNASGINPELGDKLFDPFYSTKKGDQGTGLGLAIVKTFVDRLKGRVAYENNSLGGVTFTITICKTKKKEEK